MNAFDTIAATSAPEPKEKKRSKKTAKTQVEDHGLAGNPTISAPDDNGFQTVTYDHDDEDADSDIENEGIDLDVVLRNHQLTAAAFAGDNVEQEFAQEKAAIVADEDTQTVTTTLPGWGSWTGDDLSRSERRRARGHVTKTTKPGIDPANRKDAKKEKVIMNERRQKANTKYLAGQLPFPFETKEQYERSLRLPKGPEWTTKRTHQQATKPRVMVKQGIIRPLHKPLV